MHFLLVGCVVSYLLHFSIFLSNVVTHVFRATKLFSKLVIEAPEDLRDAVWTAATLTLANGGEVVALVPTRYADTPAQGSDAEKLSRATNWVDAGGETFVGVGQRLFATDQEDVALLDVRELIFNPAPEETARDG